MIPDVVALDHNVWAPDPVYSSASKDPGVSDGGRSGDVFKCKKCRRALFYATSLLTHRNENTDPRDVFKKKNMSKKPVSNSSKRQSHLALGSDRGQSGELSQCSSLFVEPVKWMEILILGVLSGKLCCPKCRNKLGSFNWSGAQCSCGAWVAPAFQLHKNSVDHVVSS